MAKKVIVKEVPKSEVGTEAKVESKAKVETEAKVESKAKVKSSKKAMPSLSSDLADAAAEVTAKKISPPRVGDGEVKVKRQHDKFNVTIDGKEVLSKGSKVGMATEVLRHAIAKGVSHEELNAKKFVATFDLLRCYPEGSTTQTIIDELGKDKVRYATKESSLIKTDKLVMVVCNQWYPENTEKLSLAMMEQFPEISVEIAPKS